MPVVPRGGRRGAVLPGYCRGEAIADARSRYDEAGTDAAFADLRAFWERRLAPMQINTPHENMSRINPHFINNALETRNREARLEGSDTMSVMVECLSVLLNASRDRGG